MAYNSFLLDEGIIKILSLAKGHMYNYEAVSHKWKTGDFSVPTGFYKETGSDISILGPLRNILKKTKQVKENDDICSLENYLQIVKNDYLK